MKNFNDIFTSKYLEVLTINSNVINLDHQPQPIYLRSYKIINQMVDDPQLTPIPKKVFIQILKKIKTKINNKISLSYKEIYDLLNDYDYQYCDQFKQNLQKFNEFNGKLTIAILENDFDTFHKYLDDQFDSIKIDQLFDFVNQEMTAVTDSWHKNLLEDFIKQKNVLIVINRDLIQKNQQWKDSLQHQLTHFIQRIVGFDKTLKRSIKYYGPGNNQKFNENFKIIWNKILEKTSLNKNNLFAYMDRFITYLFQPSETQPNIKSCINHFQRMYQKSNIVFQNGKFKINYKNLPDRDQWLNEILKKLNGNQFYSSNEFISLFDKYFIAKKSSLSMEQMINYKKLFSYLIYFIYKCNGINIEEKLRNHFKKFKLRDI